MEKFFKKLVLLILIITTSIIFDAIAAEEQGSEKNDISEDKKTVEPVKEAKESTILAYVNGVAIKQDEVEILYKHLEGKMPRSYILNQLIQKKAVQQYLDKENFKVDDKLVKEEIAKIKEAYSKRNINLEEKMKEQGISEEEFTREIGFQVRLREYLESKTTDEEIIEGLSGVRASHILISTNEMKDEDALKKIKEIESELRKSDKLSEAFAEAAGKYSDCPSKAKGGDLGVFRRGMMVKEFSDVAFSLEVGQMSPPVKTKFGYHLIFVTERKPLSKEKYEADKEKIKTQYVQMKTMEFVNDVTEKAKVERFDETEKKSDHKTGEENKEPE